MHRRRAIHDDIVIILDELADLAVHGAARGRQADHGSRERPLVAGLRRPSGGGALLVHVDQHRAGAAQAERAGKVHADRGLAATAFLVKDCDDFGWHCDLSFSAESAVDS
jgi:hypothetical protein